MTNRFMISVAALALVAGTGFANAQGTMGRDSGSSGGQQMQHSQPSTGGAAEHGSSTMDKGSMSKEKGTVGQAGGSEEKSPGTMNKNPSAEEKSGATKGQRTDERAQGEHKSGQKDMKAEGREGRSTTGQNREGQTGTSTNAQGKSSTTTQTTGQAGAGAKLSTEQRTQITTVIHEQRVAPVSNVNFSVSVGTRVPREGIELHALPPRVATIYPEWRSYKYIVVRDEIVIVDPDSYEIIAVLNA